MVSHALAPSNASVQSGASPPRRAASAARTGAVRCANVNASTPTSAGSRAYRQQVAPRRALGEEEREVDVERLEVGVAVDLQRVDALAVVAAVGAGDGQKGFQNGGRWDPVDGGHLGAGRQARAGGQVADDDDALAAPDEPEGKARRALTEEAVGDGLRLIEEVGVGVAALRVARKTERAR